MFSDLLLVIIYVSAQISLSLEKENGNQKGKSKLDEESHKQQRWIDLFTVDSLRSPSS